MILLIPAYEPDDRLIALVREIDADSFDQRIVVVDDGSGPAYAGVFATLRAFGCDVITHHANRGKGAALKTGLAHIAAFHPGCDVVCADCDGQHAWADIVRVGDAVAVGAGDIVLGARQFVGDVPLKSRFGNTLTRAVLTMVSGLRLQDTQTGLRGYPASMLTWLGTIGGERFEYELETLLAAQRAGIGLVEVPIDTIYLDGNASSHFRPIQDSIRVYLPFLRFSLSSLFAFALDAALFFALYSTTHNLVLAVVGARAVSATVNFVTNRHLVFHDRHNAVARPVVRYAGLVIVLMTANYLLLRGWTAIGVPIVPAKALTEATLFVASFSVQQRFVFRSRPVAADVSFPAPTPAGHEADPDHPKAA